MLIRRNKYKIKRINFLIYSYIAPGNFSLLAQRKVAEKEMPKFVAHKIFLIAKATVKISNMDESFSISSGL